MELTAIVTRGGGADRLLGGWQQRTGEAVAVFNRLGQPLGRSRAFRAAALAPVGEALAHGVLRLGEMLRLTPAADSRLREEIEVTAFAGNDIVRGYLARVPAGTETAELTSPALRSLLALEYERHWLLDEPARRQRAEQLARILEFDGVGGSRTYLRGIGIDATEFRGLAIEARNETHAEVLVDDLAAVLATALIRNRKRIVECLVVGDPRQQLVDYGLDVPIGVGTLIGPEHAARSMRQASLALETSRRVGTPIEYLAGASHEFLIQAASPAYLEAFAAATLDPILSARGGQELLRTLHTWLAERRSIEATAERMQVHRHTVRNRIQRVAQLVGHDLDNIDAQTELWLALKAHGFRELAPSDIG
jgi:purine catabolism regulator